MNKLLTLTTLFIVLGFSMLAPAFAENSNENNAEKDAKDKSVIVIADSTTVVTTASTSETAETAATAFVSDKKSDSADDSADDDEEPDCE